MLSSTISRALKPSLYKNPNQPIRSFRPHRDTIQPTHTGTDMRNAVAEFVVYENERIMQRIQMHTPAAMIGRTKSADIHLNAPVVSRQHARLARVGNEYWLIDLSSTNGTKVNGQPITSIALRDGDIITFGTPVQSNIEIRFRINN